MNIKRIYIAGAINSDACGYLQNVHKMTQYADKVFKEGFAVYNPSTDLVHGVIAGDLCYDDFIRNTKAFMLVCDAVALVPSNCADSNGTRNEVLEARKHGIPVLYSFDEVKQFKNR